MDLERNRVGRCRLHASDLDKWWGFLNMAMSLQVIKEVWGILGQLRTGTLSFLKTISGLWS